MVTESTNTYRPLIVIGAPRSGTNMLRDVLCSLPKFGTWDCDEINAIWCYGNVSWDSDELPAELATEPVRRFIRAQFAHLARADQLHVVVEKTCANSLRVPFVDKVLPEARYLFLHRDPIDAVASAIKRWDAPVNIGYTLKKARYVPRRDLLRQAYRFFRTRGTRLLNHERRMAFWGPRFRDYGSLSTTKSVADLCALQWAACVDRAVNGFRAMERDKIRVLSYEQFVKEPQAELTAICDWFGVGLNASTLSQAVHDVSGRSVGKGRDQLQQEVIDRIDNLTASSKQGLELFFSANGD